MGSSFLTVSEIILGESGRSSILGNWRRLWGRGGSGDGEDGLAFDKKREMVQYLRYEVITFYV